MYVKQTSWSCLYFPFPDAEGSLHISIEPVELRDLGQYCVQIHCPLAGLPCGIIVGHRRHDDGVNVVEQLVSCGRAQTSDVSMEEKEMEQIYRQIHEVAQPPKIASNVHF